MMNNIQEAIQIVKEGGVIIFPTDTAFGIGCRMDNHEAIKRVFAIRNRPLTQPTPILVADKAMAQQYIQFLDEEVEQELMDRYWPGALTIIVPCNKSVDSLVQKNGGVGLRVPNHDITRRLIKEVGVGILGPSANIHGGKTPYRLAELDPEIVKMVDYVIEGECNVGRESTVISCLEKPWKILRQGAVEVTI